jgi:O-glycosyl hydrolase
MYKLKVKRIYLFIVFILLSAQVSAQSKKLEITVNNDIEYQTMDGFGASDAWRVQFVGKNWPLEKREYIADLLFSQNFDNDGNPVGIGLSIWRFYISAGTSEQGDSSDIKNPWRRGECFQNPDGSYNWNKQQGQQWFLKAAKKHGVEKLLAFPNAPPVHLSNNGKGYATKGDTHFNIKPGKMDDYADFLVDVIEHFNQEGIFFDYLSPVNEPQWNWDGPGQEGTPALNEEIYALVKYLSAELHIRNLRTNIIIGEAGTIGHAAIPMDSYGMERDGRDDQARFFFSETSPFYIGDMPNVEKTISAHSYHTVWPTTQQVEYRTLVGQQIKQANPDLGYWMSEYCILQANDEIGSGNGRDLGMETALYVARIIHNDITRCNAKSWQWWTAITQVDYKDGLVYLDDGSGGNTGLMGAKIKSLQYDGEARDSKLLWVLGNYSRFIRPGMVRIKCTLSEKQSVKNGLLVSAFRNPENGQEVYVLTNLSNMEIIADFNKDSKSKTYTTDKEQSLKLNLQTLNNVKIPARSVVTVLD